MKTAKEKHLQYIIKISKQAILFPQEGKKYLYTTICLSIHKHKERGGREEPNQTTPSRAKTKQTNLDIWTNQLACGQTSSSGRHLLIIAGAQLN